MNTHNRCKMAARTSFGNLSVRTSSFVVRVLYGLRVRGTVVTDRWVVFLFVARVDARQTYQKR